ncbi:inositol oxygenase isoform X2 [Cryptotermes secundus]|uniref:inositol oxygenase isoform X2 n=1 Tax=Cryptotermes secundus TaxID=105785 RepID=UPI001454D077|nr:inositol oxygenase isoform X2 [Cryptotermes secundus]
MQVILQIFTDSAVMRVVQEACGPLEVMDPSLLLRPEPTFAAKPVSMFRDYSVDPEDPIKERVRVTYHKMHTYQTVDFVRGKMDYWLRFDKFCSTVMDALVKMNDLVDESDPDVDIPNLVHAFQTAERIRADHPQEDWFHLTGLIHDLGKIMAFYGEPQWAVVGDTFPVGCAWGNSIVYRQTSFKNNPDGNNSLYNTKFGIYKPNCGLEDEVMSWGHDEYMYQVLKHNKTTLPEEALYMIRFHSFYPWHAGGDYTHLCNEKDHKMLHWVHEFNGGDVDQHTLS